MRGGSETFRFTLAWPYFTPLIHHPVAIDNSDTLVQNIMGASFFMVLNQGILGLLSVLQVFPLDIPLYRCRKYQ